MDPLSANQIDQKIFPSVALQKKECSVVLSPQDITFSKTVELHTLLSLDRLQALNNAAALYLIQKAYNVEISSIAALSENELLKLYVIGVAAIFTPR